MSRLQGKYALITGASGIGLADVVTFAREGAAGVAIAARQAELLKEACDSIQTTAPKTKILAIAADVSQPQDIERVATTLNEFQGHLDILVNNASAIGPSNALLARLSVRRFPQRSEYQPDAPSFAIKKALPAMIENGGSIINVTSDGVTGYPGWFASPNLDSGLSQTWAAELGRKQCSRQLG